MRTSTRFLTATALLLTAVASAAAATPRRAADKSVPLALEEAQRLTEAGQLREAEKAYRSIVARQRIAGQYPAEALRGAATVAFMRGDLRGAARTLDELATTAAEFGDCNSQLDALLDAAYLYTDLRDRPAVSHRMARIQTLLDTADIRSELRFKAMLGIAER